MEGHPEASAELKPAPPSPSRDLAGACDNSPIIGDENRHGYIARQSLDLAPTWSEIENPGQSLPAQTAHDFRVVTCLLQRLVRDAARM